MDEVNERVCGDGVSRTEKTIAERWRDYPTDDTYPRGGRCSTGRCGNCDWCDFMEAFTGERVVELLNAERVVARMKEFDPNDPDLKEAQNHYYKVGGLPSQSMTPRKAPWYWRRAAKLWRDRAEDWRRAALRADEASTAAEKLCKEVQEWLKVERGKRRTLQENVRNAARRAREKHPSPENPDERWWNGWDALATYLEGAAGACDEETRDTVIKVAIGPGITRIVTAHQGKMHAAAEELRALADQLDCGVPCVFCKRVHPAKEHCEERRAAAAYTASLGLD